MNETAIIRERLFNALDFERGQDIGAQNLVRYVIALLILLSLLIVVVASVPEFRNDYGNIFSSIETGIAVVFSAEYLLRIWSEAARPDNKTATKKRLEFLYSKVALIDLIAIVPTLFSSDWLFLRAFRLLILFRVIKLERYSKSLDLVVRVLIQKWHELFAAFAVILILLFCASVTMYHVEHDAQPHVFSTIPETMMWAVATVTTVSGYSNAFPITATGKAISVCISLLGITAIGLPTGIVATGLIEEYHRRQQRCPDCHKALDASYAEL